MAIIYALRRFRIYLLGIKFKIITDCQALTLTINKKILNPKISRWALELQSFDYVMQHRISGKMNHVDALSRVTNILLLNNDKFELMLAAAQQRDPIIADIAKSLECSESKLYSLINGLVYRKGTDKHLFYVPTNMEQRVIQVHHEGICHMGVSKCFDYLGKAYWFPNMKAKIKLYIDGCLKCMYYSPVSGKVEGTLHNIPKGNIPFDVIHIDPKI